MRAMSYQTNEKSNQIWVWVLKEALVEQFRKFLLSVVFTYIVVIREIMERRRQVLYIPIIFYVGISNWMSNGKAKQNCFSSKKPKLSLTYFSRNKTELIGVKL